MITKYADPSVDNNKTPSYIKHIYRELEKSPRPEFRIKKGQIINLRDNPELLKIVMATMFKHELGNLKLLSREDFEEGIAQALRYVRPYLLGSQILSPPKVMAPHWRPDRPAPKPDALKYF